MHHHPVLLDKMGHKENDPDYESLLNGEALVNSAYRGRKKLMKKDDKKELSKKDIMPGFLPFTARVGLSHVLR